MMLGRTTRAVPALANSRILTPVDEEPVWSVVCFYVDADSRGRGVSIALLETAKVHVSERGGHLIGGTLPTPVTGVSHRYSSGRDSRVR